MRLWKLALVACGLAALIAACGSGGELPNPSPAYGPVTSEQDAIAAARLLTMFGTPIEVIAPVRSGTAGELYDGVRPSLPDGAAGRAYVARLSRAAWRVDVRAVPRAGDCTAEQCDAVLWHQELIIDAQTGTLLMQAFEGPEGTLRPSA